MGWIKRVLYGALIGIAAIAPGLSGGTIAIGLGFYEDLIRAVGDLLKHFKKNFFYLLPFGAGALISVAALSVVINFVFTRYPLPANSLFIGFILGTIPFLWKKFRTSLGKKKAGVPHVLTAAIFFCLVLIPLFFKSAGADEPGGNAALSESLSSILLLAVIGMIIAATLVIPGLSGTMILMALDWYQPLLLVASTFVTALVSLDFSAAAGQLVFIIPLGVGIIIGTFLTARFVTFLFAKVPAYVYSAILGLIAATPFVMLANTTRTELAPLNLFISAAALIAGLQLVKKLGAAD